MIKITMSGIIGTFGKSQVEKALADISNTHNEIGKVSKILLSARHDVKELMKSDIEFQAKCSCFGALRVKYETKLQNTKLSELTKSYLNNLLQALFRDSIRTLSKMGKEQPIPLMRLSNAELFGYSED